MSRVIDLNADVGEGFDDAGVLSAVTSANICCGAHAGSAEIMRETIERAVRAGVACGAHPGYPDRANFGRRELALTLAELSETLGDQVSAFRAAARALGSSMAHVKPHGALYHAASRRHDVARALVSVVARFGSGAPVVGFPQSVLAEECERGGVPFVAEAFADRRYGADGELLPRTARGAVLDDPAEAASQAVRIARDGVVDTPAGEIAVIARTLCVHGDRAGAADRARAVRAALAAAGISVSALATSRK